MSLSKFQDLVLAFMMATHTGGWAVIAGSIPCAHSCWATTCENLAEMLVMQACVLCSTSADGSSLPQQVEVISAAHKDGKTTVVFELDLLEERHRFSTLLRVGRLGRLVLMKYTYVGKVE